MTLKLNGVVVVGRKSLHLHMGRVLLMRGPRIIGKTHNMNLVTREMRVSKSNTEREQNRVALGGKVEERTTRGMMPAPAHRDGKEILKWTRKHLWKARKFGMLGRGEPIDQICALAERQMREMVQGIGKTHIRMTVLSGALRMSGPEDTELMESPFPTGIVVNMSRQMILRYVQTNPGRVHTHPHPAMWLLRVPPRRALQGRGVVNSAHDQPPCTIIATCFPPVLSSIWMATLAIAWGRGCSHAGAS